MQVQGSVIPDKPTKRSYTTSQDSRLAKNWYRRFRFACRVVIKAKVRLVPGVEHPKPCSITRPKVVCAVEIKKRTRLKVVLV